MDGKASSTMIGVEKISNGKEYIVTSGLVPGDVIITEGVSRMREGTPIVPKGQAAANADEAAPAADDKPGNEASDAAQNQTTKEE